MKKLTFIILCLEGAVLSFNVAAAAALVPSIAQEFGVEQFLAGQIVWLYMLPYGMAALIYGPLVRVFDAKKIEIVCLVLFSLANMLAALSQNISALFLARFLMGVFGASVIPLVLILIAHYASEKERGKMVGAFFGATFIASLLGLFLSGVINWRLIFLIPGILGFLLTGLIYFYLPSFKQEGGAFKLNYFAALKSRRVLLIFTYIFLVSLLYHGAQQWLGVYFSKSLKLNQFAISMLITLTSLSGIFGEVIGGRLSDSLGRLKTMNLGLVFMILSVFILIFKLPIFILAITMIAWGLGWTFNHAGISTMLTDLPREFINEAASLNSSVRFISGGLGVAFSGLLMQKSFTSGYMFLGTCLLSLLIFSKKVIR